MHSYHSTSFTIFYHGSCDGEIILANTERDEDCKVIKNPTIELEASIEEIRRVVNQYIDLHGYNDYKVPIQAPLKDDKNSSGTITLDLKELVSFLAEMAIRREISRIESMSWEQSAEWWLKRRHNKQ